MSVPMPWGQALVHPVEPRQLLSLPLTFTQNALLTPEEFAKQAKERGVDLALSIFLSYTADGHSFPCCVSCNGRRSHQQQYRSQRRRRRL